MNNLTALEARVLGVIGVAVEVQPEIEEQGFDRPTTAPSPSQNIHLGPSLDNVVEDGMVSVTSPSPPLPAVLPSALSTSRQQLPTPASRRSTRRAAALPPTTPPPSSIPPQPPAASPHSYPATLHQRRVGARRRRATAFDQAASEFVAIEQRRLKLEEKRERNEARRIEVDQARTDVLSRFSDIAEAFLQQYLQSRDRIE